VEKISQNTNVAKHLIVDYFTKLSLKDGDITTEVVEKGNSKLYVFIHKNEYAWTVEI